MKKYHYKPTALVAISAIAFLNSAFASLSDFNAGEIIIDYLFNDPSGTNIPTATNSGTLGGSFDTDADNAAVVTNGAGQLDASGKNNTSFGSNYVDTPTYNSGRAIALFQFSYAFNEAIYDPSQDEELRLSIITTDPRSTFVTAEIYLQRDSATTTRLFGNQVGTGATDTPFVALGSSASLLVLMDLDFDTRDAALSYSINDGVSFIPVGTGQIGNHPTESGPRALDSVRLIINEDYSDDTMLIDRLAVSIVPEPNALILLVASLPLLLLHRRRVG